MSTQNTLQQTSLETNSSEWRDEVSDRLKAHRARRRHVAGATLPLNFEAEASSSAYTDPHEELKRVRAARRDAARMQMAQEFSVRAGVAGIQIPSVAGWSECETAELPPYSGTESPVVLEPSGEASSSFSNIIEFPRPGAPANGTPTGWNAEAQEDIAVDEQADIVAAQLRIFEADDTQELIPPTGWAGLHLDEDHPSKPEAAPEFDLPIQVAPMGKRATCIAADFVLVLLSCVVFGVMEFAVANRLPSGHNLVVFLVIPSTLLWAIYHGLFLVLGKATPGMRCTSLGICNFEDDHATRRQRMGRAFASLLSLVSLGMGYLWVFVDEDGIGWHDRMTRTYLREL